MARVIREARETMQEDNSRSDSRGEEADRPGGHSTDVSRPARAGTPCVEIERGHLVGSKSLSISDERSD